MTTIVLICYLQGFAIVASSWLHSVYCVGDSWNAYLWEVIWYHKAMKMFSQIVYFGFINGKELMNKPDNKS